MSESVTRDPIFKKLPPDILLQLSKTLKFEPVARSNPAQFLSSLNEAEQVTWLDAHREEVENHFSFVGSSLVSYITGNGKSYRQIVVDTADKLNIPYRAQDTTAEIERSIVGKVWNDTIARLTPEQREELRAQTETLAAKYGVNLGKEFAGFATLTAAQMSGFGVYLLGSTLLGAVNSALGLGLGFGVFTGLSSLISTVIGPVGWATLGLFTVLKLGGPNYKKLLPSIILMATARAAEAPGGLPEPNHPILSAPGLTNRAASIRQVPNRPKALIEASSTSSRMPANPVIQQLHWEVEQATKCHRNKYVNSANVKSPAIRVASRQEKTIFDLKNSDLAKFTRNLLPEKHYLDLEEFEKGMVDQLFLEHKAGEEEARSEQHREALLQEEHRKRERRLLRKGKTEKVNEEHKRHFDTEFPRLAEIAFDMEGRHYLELTPEEQSLIKELAANERDEASRTATRNILQTTRLAELENHYSLLGNGRAPKENSGSIAISKKKVTRQRNQFRRLLPNFAFTDQALDKLISLDDAEQLPFLSQFRLMHEGKTNGKHEVPSTNPKVWEIEAGNSGRIYYRRDEVNRITIELIGHKHHQDADYGRLQNNS